jgi:hypothetical protein
MGQPKISYRTLVVEAGTIPSPYTIRCWAHPIDEATQSLSVHVTSRGAVIPVSLGWEIFYGGYWSGGKPYEIGTTHNGGFSQGSGTITGGAEVQDILYTDAGPFLDNLIVPDTSGDHALDDGRNGFPIVCEISNTNASQVMIHVSFFLETVADWR